jgi:ribonuclease-3
VEVLIGEKRYGVGQGRTKKAAEQEAAYQAILELKGQK